ncbi:AraC family transcriptional regulator [Nocardia huaxiensis]|uniref:AraC family transcriptional regulator ligand-binding domain-containing protein n=1 Tax=Nocardia huaxiensis TaxID=2755382 RepID=A0A7D6VJL5_9NOCA|nr:AraC family transcriptional regulator [Nocardia huaxiensis]QLY31476.1 AraC family transcriptional regulator ligand-binding domain-containing protein [Nocardia huaxiensis]UFS95027.1 AraC family transcriptional regulator [Nocardia huaxiensis]
MTDGLAQLRSITSAALLVEFARGRDIPLTALLRDTGIREADLMDSTAEITLGQELALMRNVVTGVGDEPGMGLMAGLLCHPPSLGVLGFALMSCPTVREAVGLALRYADLSFTVARHTLVLNEFEASIIRDDSAVPRDLRRFAVERDVAAIWTIQQDVLPMRPPITRVAVAFPPHPVYEMFGAMLGVEEVVFNAPRSVVTGPMNIQDLQLPQANSATARFYEQQCADLVQRRKRRLGISGQVRQLLIGRGGIADQARIAADLDISVRTLRRRLADEGTTFRELTTETIGLLAEELLITGMTVEQAAIRLGYASVSAFTSAFRAWKGQSPGQFARENRGRVSSRVS